MVLGIFNRLFRYSKKKNAFSRIFINCSHKHQIFMKFNKKYPQYMLILFLFIEYKTKK